MELVRYFSFPYCFFHARLQRTRYAVWNVESAEGFPNVNDIINAIASSLRGAGVDAEPFSVCIIGWQEFQNENDYRNFSNWLIFASPSAAIPAKGGLKHTMNKLCRRWFLKLRRTINWKMAGLISPYVRVRFPPPHLNCSLWLSR